MGRCQPSGQLCQVLPDAFCEARGKLCDRHAHIAVEITANTDRFKPQAVTSQPDAYAEETGFIWKRLGILRVVFVASDLLFSRDIGLAINKVSLVLDHSEMELNGKPLSS